MKSRLRSRWHRPNEKPLESSTTNKKDSAPMGEVENTGQGFEDDLSSKKPPQKKDFQGKTNSPKKETIQPAIEKSILTRQEIVKTILKTKSKRKDLMKTQPNK